MPEFCRLPRILAVIGIAQLVVIIIAIAPTRAASWNFIEFSSASALAIWIALTSTLALCKLTPWIEKLPQRSAWIAAGAVPFSIGTFIAWAIWQIDSVLGSSFILATEHDDHFILSVSVLTGLIGGIALRYFYVRDRWQAQLRAVAKAEMDALQARIRPHFLFNSMNSIAALLRRDPFTAERAIEDLSELFRAALGAGQGESSLSDEIQLAERFLAIEKLRLDERLKVTWEIAVDVPAELRLPRLILQPLVENAVIHGVSRLADGGEIRIQIIKLADRLLLTVGNPAPPPSKDRRSNGHAQESILQRLRYHFGESAKMTSDFTSGYYSCQIDIPLP